MNFYILTNEGSNKITLKDTYLVSNTIYDGRYAIVSKDKSHKSIGLFDVVDNKELVPTKYQEINYLHDNIFAVKRAKEFVTVLCRELNDKLVYNSFADVLSQMNISNFVCKIIICIMRKEPPLCKTRYSYRQI